MVWVLAIVSAVSLGERLNRYGAGFSSQKRAPDGVRRGWIQLAGVRESGLRPLNWRYGSRGRGVCELAQFLVGMESIFRDVIRNARGEYSPDQGKRDGSYCSLRCFLQKFLPGSLRLRIPSPRECERRPDVSRTF